MSGGITWSKIDAEFTENCQLITLGLLKYTSQETAMTSEKTRSH